MFFFYCYNNCIILFNQRKVARVVFGMSVAHANLYPKSNWKPQRYDDDDVILGSPLYRDYRGDVMLDFKPELM